MIDTSRICFSAHEIEDTSEHELEMETEYKCHGKEKFSCSENKFEVSMVQWRSKPDINLL